MDETYGANPPHACCCRARLQGQLQLVFGAPPSKLTPSEPQASTDMWPSFAERWRERLDLRLTAEHAPPPSSWMLRSEEPGLPLVRAGRGRGKGWASTCQHMVGSQ